MSVTTEQKAFYNAFGFLIIRQLFSAREMNRISSTFDEMLTADRDGEPFPGIKRQSLYTIAEKSELLTGLVADDRIYETVEALLGRGFVWLGSEGNIYVGDTKWHPDGPRPAHFTPMKVSLYLDSLSAHTGCLRVVPGTHQLPFYEDIRVVAEQIPGPDLPAYCIESEPGDVLFNNMHTWHASFGGGSARRHLAVNFVPEPTEEGHIEFMKRNYEGLFGHKARHQYSQTERNFEDAFLYSEQPRIRRLAAKWVELGLE